MNSKPEHLEYCILCGSNKIRELDKAALLSRCEDCGLVFDNPRPTFQAIREYYSRKGTYDRKIGAQTAHERLSRTQVRQVRKFLKHGEILDVGAGFGQFLAHARKFFTISGTEVSSEGVELAGQMYGIELLKGEVEQVDPGARRFDGITLFQVVEHFSFPGRTLTHCVRLLKPDGLLYIAAPNEAGYSLRVVLPRLLSLLGIAKFKAFGKKGLRRIDLESMNEIHLSHFSEPVLKRYLRGLGMRIVGSGVDFLDPYTFSPGVIQIPRHVLYIAALAVRALLRVNIYNGMWIAARKGPAVPVR